MHISSPSWASFHAPISPIRPSHQGHQAKLCVIQLPTSSVFYTVVYICQCYSFLLLHTLLSLPCPHIPSLYLHLYSCPANSFINTIFLDIIYTLFLTYFPLYVRLYIHPPQSNWLTFITFYSVEIPYIFSFWLTSLCIAGSEFIHLSPTYSNWLLFMAEYILYIYIYMCVCVCVYYTYIYICIPIYIPL